MVRFGVLYWVNRVGYTIVLWVIIFWDLFLNIWVSIMKFAIWNKLTSALYPSPSEQSSSNLIPRNSNKSKRLTHAFPPGASFKIYLRGKLVWPLRSWLQLPALVWIIRIYWQPQLITLDVVVPELYVDPAIENLI